MMNRSKSQTPTTRKRHFMFRRPRLFTSQRGFNLGYRFQTWKTWNQFNIPFIHQNLPEIRNPRFLKKGFWHLRKVPKRETRNRGRRRSFYLPFSLTRKTTEEILCRIRILSVETSMVVLETLDDNLKKC